jgi:hypothetical protein
MFLCFGIVVVYVSCFASNSQDYKLSVALSSDDKERCRIVLNKYSVGRCTYFARLVRRKDKKRNEFLSQLSKFEELEVTDDQRNEYDYDNALSSLLLNPIHPEVKLSSLESKFAQQISENAYMQATQNSIRELEAAISSSKITKQGDADLVLQAVQFLRLVKNSTMWLDGGELVLIELPDNNTDINSQSDILNQKQDSSWQAFLDVLNVLKKFNAVHDTSLTHEYPEPSQLGQLVSSLTCENELWVALILSQELSGLDEHEFAALLASTQLYEYRAQNNHFSVSTSNNVQVGMILRHYLLTT